MALETYSRNPKGKHEILENFGQQGYDLPDTPIMAFHRGDIPGLEKHLRRDPRLIERPFTLREIFPLDCGCANDGRSGMHWTPIDGAEVRLPFPCFAFVFTDRYTLSMAERMLSMDKAPAAGHFLRVATVYVIEERRENHRMLSLTFALDALGADPPHLVTREVSQPQWALLHITINATLYAITAGVAPEFRPGVDRTAAHREPFRTSSLVFSSEEVFFLPGKIDISQVRKLQALERVGTGRQLVHRFMVRGRWRRAAPGWKDQSVRWIKPYWKGPDMAAVVERAYRLRP